MGLSEYNLKALSSHFTTDDVVMVAPLYWGLGHATRCIPIIHWLNSQCKKVIIASDGAALELLKQEFPDLTYEVLPKYNIRYRYHSMIANLILGSFRILKAIFLEKKSAQHLTKKYGVTVILSDNRLGFFNPKIKSLYMTHQVNLLHAKPWISKLGTQIHRYYIRKFDHCLIPDFEGVESICPKLSHGLTEEYTFIGPLSRIEKLNLSPDIDILVILSGPEPQRTILEEELFHILVPLKTYKIVFVRGSNNQFGFSHLIHDNFTCLNLVSRVEIEHLLNTSRLLIARSGYTTIMDIRQLDIKGIWIPTPGQTEQEYLAKKLTENTKYKIINQNDLNNIEEFIKILI